MTSILPHPKLENNTDPSTPEFSTAVSSPQYHSPSSKKTDISHPGSPSSGSDRSSTPSSTTSTAATSILDSSELVKTSLPPPSSLSSSASTPIPTTATNANIAPASSVPVKKEKKEKKERKEKKQSNRALTTASGISTSVPVTGARPKPTSHPTLDDDVLMAIFEILFLKDSKAEGMTVKQICDILIEKHPDMAKLSSKTSNLVSAKLNAYVKRVEKGDQNIIYALSRDWADASPKRMVYVYRGLLAKDYHLYVQKVIETQKANMVEDLADSNMDSDSSNHDSKRQGQSKKKSLINNNSSGNYPTNLPAGFPPSSLQLDKGSSFMDTSMDFRLPQLSIPYASAPVTASLNNISNFQNDTLLNESNESNNHTSQKSSRILKESANSRSHWLSALHDSDSDSDEDGYDSLQPEFADSEEENELYANNGYYRRGSMIVRDKVPSTIGKRSKSMSFIQSKKPKTSQQHSSLTAAAATPRIPKQHSIANSPSAAAAVAALRAAALNTFNSPVVSEPNHHESVHSITNSIMSDTSVEPSISMKWLETVRSGFLTQEIGAPEDITLAELDDLFA